MRLIDIVETSRRVAATRSRLKKVEHLTSLLARLAPDEMMTAVSYLSGALPQGRIGLGPALVRDAVTRSPSGVPRLGLSEVDEAFSGIANTTGAGSTAERRRALSELFGRATGHEQDFLARLILGDIRQGALEGVMTEAVARAAGVAPDDVRRAVMISGDLPRVAEAALTLGAAGLSRFTIHVLHPLKPMLAQSAESVEDALVRMGRAGFEYKLDGARVQVHKSGADVSVFSRLQNDVTSAVPEVVEAAQRLPVRDLILDGETIALRHDGTPHPFQVTMQRFGRKLDVERMRAKLPLAAFFFDCLHLAGDDLIDRPAVERFGALSDALPPELLIPRVVTADRAEAEAFLAQALERGHEGVMAKALDEGYQAGSRGSGWLKIKPVHTLDLVVLGAEWGHGRRRGWLSNLHLGARDPQSGQFVMLGKTFKGLTDEMLEWQTENLQALAVDRDKHTVYVRPELVVEVAFNDVQTSPQYPAGLALRFARVRRYRPDKNAADADTLDTVRAIHEGGTLL
jgi:DNA ligase-1